MKLAKNLCRKTALSVLVAVFILAEPLCFAGQLPTDVRSDHWAAGSVEQILKSGVMSVLDDHQFHGEAHVSHLQAVIALAAIAKKLENGTWQVGVSKPVPDKVEKTLTAGAWKNKLITRYELASALVRFGNYFAAAIPLPKPGAKDLGKSEILPADTKIPVPAGSPVYGAYKYLVDGKMISPNSPLLKADKLDLKAGELSRGIAEAADGVADKLTEMGKDDQGNTPDKSFHTKKSSR